MTFMLIACSALVWLASAQGQQSGVPGPGQSRTGRLGELERKAEERDQMVRHCRELESELASLRDLLSGKSESLAGLTNLVTTAAVSNAASAAGGEAGGGTGGAVGLGDRLRELQETIRSQAERIRGLESEVAAMAASNTLLTATGAGLAAANKRLAAGNYEYYEVRKGDTLETIAASKQVYGTAARSEWLRQANWKRVQNIDNLRAGEVLIVPRYPPGADFDY